jgi:glutamate carboxypeptidase
MKAQSKLDTQEVRTIVDSLQEDLLALLDKMVSLNSHSHNPLGVARVAQVIGRALPSPLRLTSEASSGGGIVWICRQAPPDENPIFLVGHLDTVFPPGTFDSGVVSQDPYLRGPGVADMKGGVAVILGALWTLHRLGLLPEIPLLLALNGDEEIGSPGSAAKLMELARSCRLGLVFECGGPDGSVVTSRRGLSSYRLKVSGEAGHSGDLREKKSSAVVELAHQILNIESLNDPQAGVSINVGKVKGGTAASIIPSDAEAHLSVRFWEQTQGGEVERQMIAFTASASQSGLKAELSKAGSRPAMPPTDANSRLFAAAASTGERFQMQLPEEARGGASDANLLAAVGLPTIDGLGPIGEMDHSKNERILKDSLFQRVELLAHLLWDLRGWTP